jgi:hypothetical protein
MNNEPVAWMYEDASGTMKMLGNTRLEEWVTKFGCKEIPLYTHPADLTDEEIENIAYKVFEMGDGKEALFEFARAILKKASER